MTLLAAELIDHANNGWQLIFAAVLGIAVIVVLITWLKVHPFLALRWSGSWTVLLLSVVVQR